MLDGSVAIRARHFPEYKSEVLGLEPAYLSHLIYLLFYQTMFYLQNICNCRYRTITNGNISYAICLWQRKCSLRNGDTVY